ncbi:MAG: asparagine synthase (glutamine-hydrolyzing) [Acidobacteria bacterium]|nr:asparagine synthase (glutamine-hydrolyzing) [Acidobacteriota bacterium]
MCGIVGIFNYGTHEKVNARLLHEMRDCMTHRGPDDCGIYVDIDRSIGLGHRRLSIIDLSPAGRQPMCGSAERFWITFNGEIYNYGELRADLEKTGVHFRSKSDTEVLIYLYEKHGKDMLRLLRGMFAFAIWDAEQRMLFIARDRIGVKPLYWADRNGSFIFASEIKAILASGKIGRAVDSEAFYHYLSFLTTPAPKTLFEGIFKLPAGHRMTVDARGRIDVEQWWSPLQKKQRLLPEETYVRDIRDLLEESIRYRMVSDVPFGVFLSGGIDSSTNVALMAGMMDRPVQTFTIGFKNETQYNEFEFARQVARRFHTDHHEVRIGMRDLVDFLPQLVHHQDEPIADPVCIPVYYVAKLAKDQGVTVCQVGEGSDELFCGYPHWSYMLSLERLRRRYAIVPKPLRQIASFFAGCIEDTSSARREFIRRASNDEPFFWGGAEAFYEAHKRSILHADMHRKLNGANSANIVGAYFREFIARADNPDPLAWMTFIDLKLRLPELLLMRVDKMTMAASVEARVPFLDHKLVEYVMSIPQDRKVPGLQPKYLLKKTVRGLIPDDIVDRPKQGFGVPVAEWFQQELGQTMRTKLLDFARRGSIFDASQIERVLTASSGALPWYLFNFVLWHEAWIEQTSSRVMAPVVFQS